MLSSYVEWGKNHTFKNKETNAKKDSMNTALLLIDIQNDYFENGANPLAESLRASENAAKILEKFRINNLPVIHVGIFLSHNQDGSFNFIHSANGGGVRIDNSNAGYYAKRYVTGCTVIPEKKKLYKFDPVQVKSFYESDNEVLYASTGKVHKVKKGESLYTIAKEYNVSEDQLKEWNKLSDTKLKPGQKLSIQSGKNSDKSKNNDSKATPSNRTGETHGIGCQASGGRTQPASYAVSRLACRV